MTILARSTPLLATLALFTGACDAADVGSDTAADEASDAGPVDSDGDGLSDAREAELGTDPMAVDTDEDGYWDSWEVAEGTDPLDYDDRIYAGFWPYNPNKDALEQGTWDQATRLAGSLLPRASYLDQYGDLVDTYDFSEFTGTPSGNPASVVIDVSAQWCSPCHAMADWLAGVDSETNAFYEQQYPTVVEKINERRVLFVTVVGEDIDGNPPTLADVELWHELHPSAVIPALADEAVQFIPVYAPGAVPQLFVLSPEMVLEYWQSSSANAPTVLQLIEENL